MRLEELRDLRCLDHYKTSPERAFTAEMSDELMLPDALTSNLKLLDVVVCPERALTPLISLEFTDRELLPSPTRKPIDADAVAAGKPLMLASAMETR